MKPKYYSYTKTLNGGSNICYPRLSHSHRIDRILALKHSKLPQCHLFQREIVNVALLPTRHTEDYFPVKYKDYRPKCIVRGPSQTSSKREQTKITCMQSKNNQKCFFLCAYLTVSHPITDFCRTKMRKKGVNYGQN